MSLGLGMRTKMNHWDAVVIFIDILVNTGYLAELE